MEDLAERECGDAERMGSSAAVVGRDGVGDDPALGSASCASIEGVDSSSSGYRDGDATRAVLGEKDGGGFTGVPSPGDVMDTGCSLRIWAYYEGWKGRIDWEVREETPTLIGRLSECKGVGAVECCLVVEAKSFNVDRRTQTEARTLRQLDRQAETIFRPTS